MSTRTAFDLCAPSMSPRVYFTAATFLTSSACAPEKTQSVSASVIRAALHICENRGRRIAMSRAKKIAAYWSILTPKVITACSPGLSVPAVKVSAPAAPFAGALTLGAEPPVIAAAAPVVV